MKGVGKEINSKRRLKSIVGYMDMAGTVLGDLTRNLDLTRVCALGQSSLHQAQIGKYGQIFALLVGSFCFSNTIRDDSHNCRREEKEKARGTCNFASTSAPFYYFSFWVTLSRQVGFRGEKSWKRLL